MNTALIVALVMSLLFAVVVIIMFYTQQQFLSQFLARSNKPTKAKAPKPSPDKSQAPQVLVDTSAIIDGRIADIIKTGFVPGKLLVPRFVLAELQNIADSDDAMRRGRGRRGLEMLNHMRQDPNVELDIIEENPEDVKEVDHKLVYLAKKFNTNILTTDYNLNRVATIDTVKVLNVNELANAIRPVVLPGEELVVKVVQPGKEKNQGVGYLADGTMIVVENGDKLMGKEVTTEVTRIFQTVAGKMIFAAEKGSKGSQQNGAGRTNGNGRPQPSRNNGNGKPYHARPQRPKQTPLEKPVVEPKKETPANKTVGL